MDFDGQEKLKELKESLKREVAERKEIIAKIISGVGAVVAKEENLVSQPEPGYPNLVYELTDIKEFSFRASYKEGGMMGNEITIWPAACVGAPCNPPLEIFWETDPQKCRVSGDDSFLRELPDLIERIPTIIATRKEKEAKRKKDFEEKMRKDEEFAQLVADAKRLGIKVQ